MKKKTLLVTCIIAVTFLLFDASGVKAQQPDLTFSYTVAKRASINPVNNFDTIYDWRCVLNIADTAGIDTIYVKMGTSLGTADKVSHGFEFDNDATVPNGWIYRRDSTQVTLHLGNYPERTYFIEVQLQDTLNNLSTLKKWNNQ